MSNVVHVERATQNRIIALLSDELGYRYIGNWSDRTENSNVEDTVLSEWLTKRGVTSPRVACGQSFAALVALFTNISPLCYKPFTNPTHLGDTPVSLM